MADLNWTPSCAQGVEPCALDYLLKVAPVYAPGGARTTNIPAQKRVLYQLSYTSAHNQKSKITRHIRIHLETNLLNVMFVEKVLIKKLASNGMQY